MASRGVLVTAIFTLVGFILLAVVTFALSYRPAYGATWSSQNAVTYTTNASGQRVAHVTLNIVVQVGRGPHADWLGYQTRGNTPNPFEAIVLPRNTLVVFDIHNYDSATALRNPFFTAVHGTIGNVEYVNGKKVSVMDPGVVSHTFTIPQFNVTVPMMAVASNAPPTKFQDIQFTFRTPNRPGSFRWQCFVPCGSGLYGNGGPMSQIGYMGGLIKVK